MSTNLDDRIQSLLMKLDGAAPVAPEFEALASIHERAQRVSRRDRTTGVPTHRRHVSLLKVVAAGVVAAAVVGGLRMISIVRNGSMPPSSAPIEGQPPVLDGLPILVAPSAFPDGWGVVDVVELPASTDTATPASEFLFRRAVDGAAVFIDTRLDDQASLDTGDVRASFADSGQATWSIDGARIWMRVAGVDAESAQQLSQSVTFQRAGDDLIAGMPSSSEFTLEASTLASSVTTRRHASGLLQMSTPNGIAQLNLTTANTADDAVNHFGVPHIAGPSTMYVSFNHVVRDPIDKQISIDVYVSNPADLPAAQELAASLQPVEASAWDAMSDTIATTISRLPVTQRISLGGIEVTEHRDAALVAVCATIGDAQRCRSSQGAFWGDNTDTFAVDLVVNDVWIHTGATNTGPPAEPTLTPDQGPVTGHWTHTGSGSFYAYALPSATTAELAYTTSTNQGTATQSFSGSLERPIR